MGSIRFLLPQSERIPLEQIDLVYMASLDGIPIPRDCRLNDRELLIQRESNDSGKVFFPYCDRADRLLLIPTGTVVERENPYPVLLEMARGIVDRLRNQHDFWLRCGFEFSETIKLGLSQCGLDFCRAACDQGEPKSCDSLAERIIDRAIATMDSMAREYAEQVIKIRREQEGGIPTLLGCGVTPASAETILSHGSEQVTAFAKLFDTVQVHLCWRELESEGGEFNFQGIRRLIETFRAENLRVVLGPLVRLREDLLPSHVLEAVDFEHVRRSLRQFVGGAIRELGDCVDASCVIAGLNAVGELPLPSDYVLRLAIDAVEAARENHADLPLLIGFDQPWSESGSRDAAFSPLQAADAITRADLGVSAFLLEINWGVGGSGTLPRDALQTHTMLDLWSQFELPLFIQLAIPGGPEGTDDACDGTDNLLSCRTRHVDKMQAEALRFLGQICLSKPFVQALLWSHWQDSESARFPGTGLRDVAGRAKSSEHEWSQLANRRRS